MKDTEVLITSNADRNFAYERDERVVSVDEIEKDAEFENVLRPKNFEGYIGQKKAKENLAVSIASAKMRQDTRQDYARAYRRQRDGREYQGSQRAGS